MTNGSHTTADGITARPDYAYDAPPSFFAENAVASGAGVFNVKDFGAVASATIDNRAAIQAAVDAAEKAGGGVVYIPPGVYGIAPEPDGDGGIKIKDNVFIKGAGMGETVLRVMDHVGEKITGIVRSTYGQETNNFGVSDLTLDGNRANNPESTDHSADLRVDGFFCGGMPEGDVTVSDVTLLRVEIQNCSGYGFDPHERTTRLLIDSSLAHHNGKDGFVADYVVDGEYRNNLAYANGRHGFNITTSTNNFQMEDNIARDNGGAGVDVQRGSFDIPPPDNIVIRGNVIENNARDGILLQMTGNVLVEDNTISGSGRSGIRLFGAQDVTIRGNTISTSSQSLTNGYPDIQIREYDDRLGVSAKLWSARNVLVEHNSIVADVNGTLRSSVGIEEQAGAVGGSLIRDNTVLGQVRETFSIEDSDTRVIHSGSSLDEVIAGARANDLLKGMGGADKLQGFDGNDHLDGGADADKMYGGKGDDTYSVDSSADRVTELADEGIDTVYATATFAIKANIEKLVLVGVAHINGKGNLDDNSLTGNSGDNKLEGGDGNDNVYGGGGADALFGGNGDDYLNGGAGADKMAGGLGDDRYVVDMATDAVSEDVAAGTDSVFASVSHTLAGNFEYLYLSGTVAIDGTGNAGDNILAGNAGASILKGLDGADKLFDGAGIDALVGGNGDDRFQLAADGVHDAVSGDAGAGDTIDLGNAIGATTVLFNGLGSGTISGGGLGTGQFSGIEAIWAGKFNDSMTGSDAAERLLLRDGNDTAHGGGGADIIYGDGGNDAVFGDGGNDTIYTGRGNDQVTGGLGRDAFVFKRAAFASGEKDVILDFHEVTGDFDVLRLEGAAADYAFANSPAGSVLVTHLASGGSVEIQHFTVAQLTGQTTYF